MLTELDLLIHNGRFAPQELLNTNQEYPTAVLISNKGSGSNLKSIVELNENGLVNTPVKLVVSDKPGAVGFSHVDQNTPQHVLTLHGQNRRERNENRAGYSQELAELLNSHGIQIAVLAGFMTILDESYFKMFKGVTLNIHPGWIPDRQDQVLFFPDGSPAYWNRGMMTDDAVAQFNNSNYAGSSIHIATPVADFGPVLERVYITKKRGEDLGKVYDRLKVEEHRGMGRALKNPERIMRLAGKFA